MVTEHSQNFYFKKAFPNLSKAVLLIPLLWPVYFAGEVSCRDGEVRGQIWDLDFKSIVLISFSRILGFAIFALDVFYMMVDYQTHPKWLTIVLCLLGWFYSAILFAPFYFSKDSGLGGLEKTGKWALLKSLVPYALLPISLVLIARIQVRSQNIYLWIGIAAASSIQIARQLRRIFEKIW